MKAITFNAYGSPTVLQVTQVKPLTPKPNELLIRVRATTVTSGDCRARQGNPLMVRAVTGIFKPKVILGSEFAGEVLAVGSKVTKFKVGERVFGSTGMKMGAHAECICISEDEALSRMPDGITFEAATAVPFGATTALVFLRDKGRIQKGQRVLIYGASGSVGSAAVQLAKSFGAQVTAVCSTEKVDKVKSVGVDDVIDYKKGDFTKKVTLKYDLIFDAVGKTSIAQCRSILAKDGTYITLALSLPIIFQTVWTTLFGKQRVIGTVVSGSAQDMQLLKTYIEAGKFNPVVDRAYPMTQIAEAHRYVDNGRKWGNVVVTF